MLGVRDPRGAIGNNLTYGALVTSTKYLSLSYFLPRALTAEGGDKDGPHTCLLCFSLSTPRLMLEFDLLIFSFGQLPLALMTWFPMFLSTLLVPYQALRLWARPRAAGAWTLGMGLGCALLAAHTAVLCVLPVHVALKYQLPPASRCVLVFEQVMGGAEAGAGLPWGRALETKVQVGAELVPRDGVRRQEFERTSWLRGNLWLRKYHRTSQGVTRAGWLAGWRLRPGLSCTPLPLTHPSSCLLGCKTTRQKDKVWALTLQILQSACLSSVNERTEMLSDLLKATQQCNLPSLPSQVRFLMKSYSFLREAVPGTVCARVGEALGWPCCALSPFGRLSEFSGCRILIKAVAS